MGSAEPMSLQVPGIEIRVNDQPLPLALASRLCSARVDDELDLPGVFELEFAGAENPAGAGETAKTARTWLDAALPLALGDEVEIRLGPAEKLASVIIGDLIALEPCFRADRPPRLTVRGYDRRHRLTRGRRSRTFVKMKDHEVARQIADALGIAIDSADSGLKPTAYLVQHNQTDLDFLRERARRIDFALTIAGRTLGFKPAGYAAGAALTLELGADILEFEPRLTLGDQASELRLRGWDVAGKKALNLEAAADALPAMGGKDSGAALAKKHLRDAPAQLSQQPVVTAEEGARLARADYARRTLQTIRGEARLWGRTDLRAGMVVHIDGAGTRFSGDYYLEAVEHLYEPHRSYHTTIRVLRTAT